MQGSALNLDTQTTDEFNILGASAIITDDGVLQCYVSFPEVDLQHPFLLDFNTMARQQAHDVVWQQMLQRQPGKFAVRDQANGVKLICHQQNPAEPWKICIPTDMLDNIINWYHQVLSYIGMSRLIDTIGLHYYHHLLRDRVEQLVGTCDYCQRFKAHRQSYGELPPRDVQVAPWYEVAVDTIGPWTLEVDGIAQPMRCLTMIDTVTNYLEVIPLRSMTAQHVADTFRNNWLARYPRPMRIIFDQGSEFKGEFRRLCDNSGIEIHVTGVASPTANAVCERMHKTIADCLRTMQRVLPVRSETDAQQFFENAVATATYAMRASIHRSLKATPGSIAFRCDMLLDIP